MIKAVECWHGGSKWYELWIDGKLSHMVPTKDEAIQAGADKFTETEEPRFLVRDESGRGGAVEVAYTDFTAEEREYREESYDIDGEEEETTTFGEWLDSSSAGDEFDNSDSMFTVTRIN